MMDELPDQEAERSTTLLPRFSTRTLLAISTGCALAFVIAGTAYRGHPWAWAFTIGLMSLGITALFHAAWFGIMTLLAQLVSAAPTDSE